MRCLVNGQEIPCQYLARRGPTNFNQPFPEPTMPLPYQISVEVDDFISALTEYYDRYVRDEVADASYHEIGEFPLLDRWQQLGYPPLNDLVHQAPDVLELLIKDWFNQDILDRIIPGPEVGLPRFLVNTIDEVSIDNGQVRIEGKVYVHPKLRQEGP